MSAIAIVYERENTLGEPSVFNRVMERLSHRGPDGSDCASLENITMGHWHFWTTPEEVGERQPLELNGLPFKIVLDGRIDNREELFGRLGIPAAEGRLLSDAALILRAYAHWGESCFKYFIGEFALVIFDKNINKVVLVRDPLGDRTLFYAFRGACLIVASEPWAVAGADDASKIELDESAIAHYFALKIPEDGRTFFKNVYELLPAHLMVVNVTDRHSERYWQPNPLTRVHYKSDKEYAENFLHILDESVRCRLRSTMPAGVQMSGGLDSPSIACLAARTLPSGSLTAISYIFDDPADCDERHYIEAIKNQANINSIQFMGDDLWLFKDWQAWPQNPNAPEIMPYRLLLNGVYSRAQQAGVRVLLTGSFGDHLYQGGRAYWLSDLIAEGRIPDALRELKMLFQQVGLRQMLRERYLQHAVIKLLHISSILDRRHTQHEHPAWLTSFSIGFLSEQITARFDPVFNRHASVSALGLLATMISTHEIPHASSHTVELRYPYRDRRLVEFVLAIPAYQLFYHGLTKYILRNAMRGILPEIVRTRRQPTSLVPFYNKGLKNEEPIFEAYYQKSDALWRKFVREGQLMEIWQGDLHQTDSPSLLPWLCITFEKWFGSIKKFQTAGIYENFF